MRPASPPVKTKVKTAKVFGIGPDGRKRYTADPDARAGHRSATGNRNAGPYVGYELHLAVQTRDVRWTNHIDKTTLGPEVPGVITTCNLVAAGSHRGEAIVDALIASKKPVHDITDVVWDPGYSLCQPGTTTYPLAQAGIEQTLELVTHQRGIRPFAGEALLLDGQLYSPFLPAELRDLASPPRFATGAYRRAYEEKFNRRARWRLVRHAAARRRRCDPLALPVLCGAAPESQVPDDDATLSPSTDGGDARGGDEVLFRHPVGAAGRAPHHPEDPVRNHGVADLDVPAPSCRVGQLRAQRCFR